jgi:hypothetical protein
VIIGNANVSNIWVRIGAGMVATSTEALDDWIAVDAHLLG